MRRPNEVENSRIYRGFYTGKALQVQTKETCESRHQDITSLCLKYGVDAATTFMETQTPSVLFKAL